MTEKGLQRERERERERKKKTLTTLKGKIP